MEFFLNDGTSDIVNGESISGDSTSVFTIPVGYEFVGVRGKSGATGWADFKVWITCATRADSGITIDLSTINGRFLTVMSGATVSLSFSVTDSTSGACGALVYAVSISPTPATGGLISIPNSSTPSIQFLASTNSADINSYNLTVSAYYSGSIAACPAVASAIYMYHASGCLTTTITPNLYGDISAPLNGQSSTSFNQWRDSVSGPIGPI